MPDETFTPPTAQEHEPVEVVKPDFAAGRDENVITELVPAPDLNPHGRVTGEVTTDLATGKVVKASYPQDGAATHK
jgi:hypothetical protein